MIIPNKIMGEFDDGGKFVIKKVERCELIIGDDGYAELRITGKYHQIPTLEPIVEGKSELSSDAD